MGNVENDEDKLVFLGCSESHGICFFRGTMTKKEWDEEPKVNGKAKCPMCNSFELIASQDQYAINLKRFFGPNLED